ncbi:MAG: spore coat protein [Oscillospiraceae bacterium]|jgi:spore coat protein CotF|nr:spore coat protein [Oscillospiraceae bacterium]
MPASTPKAMTDKEYIEDVLLTAKTLCGMYHYATQESSTEGLHNQFKCNLNDSIAMQHRIFGAMQQNGWYPQQQAQPQQINQVRSKYSQ